MREALQAYVKRVGKLAEHVRGNEQATKQSLVGPLFTILGYDLTDPRECIPEYRVDFGPNRIVFRIADGYRERIGRNRDSRPGLASPSRTTGFRP
jgi:predicted type IV restriction endonuclease